jgi:hypothetical protein
MASTAETRAAGATAFEEFTERYLAKLKRAERARALAALRTVVLEAQAAERRRLCTDARYFAAAVALTQDEIARHGTRSRGPRSTSHLAARVRSARASLNV